MDNECGVVRFRTYCESGYSFNDHCILNEERDLRVRTAELFIKRHRRYWIQQRKNGTKLHVDLQDKYIFCWDMVEPVKHLSYTDCYSRLHCKWLFGQNGDG